MVPLMALRNALKDYKILIINKISFLFCITIYLMCHHVHNYMRHVFTRFLSDWNNTRSQTMHFASQWVHATDSLFPEMTLFSNTWMLIFCSLHSFHWVTNYYSSIINLWFFSTPFQLNPILHNFEILSGINYLWCNSLYCNTSLFYYGIIYI